MPIRASSFAGYVACDYRALLDHQIQAGELAPSPPHSSPYAALGTITHYFSQRAVNARFIEEPTISSEDWSLAASLFGDDLTTLQRVVDLNARRVVEMLPSMSWTAELAVETDRLTGHLDLINDDRTVMVDIKTTARKPDHMLTKPEHLVQMAQYRLLVPTLRKCYVPYVDSLKAGWGILCEIDFTTDEFVTLLSRYERYCEYLNNRDLLQAMAVPRMGPACKSLFCPHRERCLDTHIREPGILYESAAARVTAPRLVNPFGG